MKARALGPASSLSSGLARSLAVQHTPRLRGWLLWLHSPPWVSTGPGVVGSTACSHAHSQGPHQSWNEEAMISSIHNFVWT